MNYIKGLFDTDGSYGEYIQKEKYKTYNLTITQKNLNLLKEVKRTLELNDIKCNPKIYDKKKY